MQNLFGSGPQAKQPVLQVMSPNVETSINTIPGMTMGPPPASITSITVGPHNTPTPMEIGPLATTPSSLPTPLGPSASTNPDTPEKAQLRQELRLAQAAAQQTTHDAHQFVQQREQAFRQTADDITDRFRNTEIQFEKEARDVRDAEVAQAKALMKSDALRAIKNTENQAQQAVASERQKVQNVEVQANQAIAETRDKIT